MLDRRTACLNRPPLAWPNAAPPRYRSRFGRSAAGPLIRRADPASCPPWACTPPFERVRSAMTWKAGVA